MQVAAGLVLDAVGHGNRRAAELDRAGVARLPAHLAVERRAALFVLEHAAQVQVFDGQIGSHHDAAAIRVHKPRCSHAGRLNMMSGTQIVDDSKGHTLASASTMEKDLRAASADKTKKARTVGQLVADRAKAKGVTQVVFDRGGNRYTGRVAALAEGARENGLDF